MLISLLAAVFVVAESRVTFPYSEVLQANDLVNNAASFNCGSGCKVYVDRPDDALYVSSNGNFVASFTDIVGNTTWSPDGIELPAGKSYKLQSRSSPVADFVFYAVGKGAAYYGTPVYVPQQNKGVTANFQSRYFTVLSRFNAIEFSAISGSYLSGYPQIFNTGYDAVSDARCLPVYQARSQYSAEQSMPMIFSPIITFDFGFVGKHAVTAVQKDGKNVFKSAVSSAVYMSPGYVGCSMVGNQVYYSNVKTVQDGFKLVANSLDINARFTNLAANEAVKFRVNGYTLDFSGTSTMKKSFGYGTQDVSLSWTRTTTASSWALQLDFGIVSTGGSTTSRPVVTTSSVGALSIFISSIIVAIVSSSK